jgi:hypothetical protein
LNFFSNSVHPIKADMGTPYLYPHDQLNNL